MTATTLDSTPSHVRISIGIDIRIVCVGDTNLEDCGVGDKR